MPRVRYIGPSPARRTPFGVVKRGDTIEVPEEYRGRSTAEEYGEADTWELVGAVPAGEPTDPEGGDE